LFFNNISNTGQIEYFSVNDGLGHNRILSVLEAPDGNIWVSTENGLNYLRIEKENKYKNDSSKVEIYTFTKENGLIAMDFNGQVSIIDNTGLGWWGSGKGVTTLKLDEFTLAKTPPRVQLNSVSINQQECDFHNMDMNSADNDFTFGAVQSFNNIPEDLVLEHTDNYLTFYFSANDWAAQDKVQYSYMMTGEKNKWSTPSKEAKAEYRNLKPGSHTFLLRAFGESKQWTKPVSLSFKILPPWWLTWWAKLIYFLSALGIIYLFIRWRTYNLQRKQKELELEIAQATEDIVAEKKKSDNLLLNILPVETAMELKDQGYSEARLIKAASVIFIDFSRFTTISEILRPKELVAKINECFSAFDDIMEKYGIEKIKTIGDSYMAAGGLPNTNNTHTRDSVLAALEVQEFLRKLKYDNNRTDATVFEARIGIHSGPVVAGIVGKRKFQYDIWGDTVNIASRMESAGEVSKVNISKATYTLLKDQDDLIFSSRGELDVKGKGKMEMYYVSRRPIMKVA
jgi:class 3 adenylate cyclase